MKKLFSFLISLVLLALCGCNNASLGVTAVTEGISFKAEIECNNEFYEFKVKIPENSNMLLEVISPKRIAGSVFEISDSSILLVSQELQYKTVLEDLPENSPVAFIYNVFSDVATKAADVKLQNDEYYISGKIKSYDYKLILGNSGLPIKITDNKNNITVIIKEATIN